MDVIQLDKKKRNKKPLKIKKNNHKSKHFTVIKKNKTFAEN